MGEGQRGQPFKLVTDAVFADGRRKRGEVEFSTHKGADKQTQRRSSVPEVFSPGLYDDVAELREEDPRRAQEMEDYLKTVEQDAQKLFTSDRASHDASVYADLLGTMGEKLFIAKIGELSGGTGDAEFDAKERLKEQAVADTFHRIGEKLFPNVTKPANREQAMQMLDLVVLDLKKMQSDTDIGVLLGNDKEALGNYSPSEQIRVLQQVTQYMAERMHQLTNLGGVDEFRGFGVEPHKVRNVVELARSLHTLNQVIEQMKKDEFGRDDVSVDEAKGIEAAKAKISSRFEDADARSRETELDGGVDNGENSVEQSPIAHAHFDALLMDTSVDAIQAEIRRLEKKNAGLSPDANAAARDAELLLKMLPGYAKRLTDSERNKQRGKAGRQVSQSGESPRVTQGLIDLIKVSPLHSWSDTIKQVANPDLKRLLKKLEVAVES